MPTMTVPPDYYYGHPITPTFDWNTGAYFYCKKTRPSPEHPQDCACWQRWWYKKYHEECYGPTPYHGFWPPNAPYPQPPYPYPPPPFYAGAHPPPPNYGPAYPHSPYHPTTPYPFGAPPPTPYTYPYNPPPHTPVSSSPFAPPSIFHQSTPASQPRNYASIHNRFGYDYRGRPRLVWDVSRPIKHARARGSDIYQAWKPPEFKNIAIHPAPSGGQELSITTSTHPLVQYFMSSRHWGPISIKTENGVTVGDVMKAIYEYFQEPLTDNDLKILRENPQNENTMQECLKQRAGENFVVHELGLSCGYRRIDSLGGQRTFAGLVWGNMVLGSPDIREMVLCLVAVPLPNFIG